MKIRYFVLEIYIDYTRPNAPIQFASKEELFGFCKEHLDESGEILHVYLYDSLEEAKQKLKELKSKMTYAFDDGFWTDQDKNRIYGFETDFALIKLARKDIDDDGAIIDYALPDIPFEKEDRYTRLTQVNDFLKENRKE